MHSSHASMTAWGRASAILRVTSGNFLEQLIFSCSDFYATYIAHTFFPASSEFASLMMDFRGLWRGLFDASCRRHRTGRLY
nr:major facilitator superfamily permease [Raoultella sp. NCTC 9187]